jgi:hypothetical protein
MPSSLLVDDLVNMVRDGIDERNLDTVTNSDILQCMNRAQDYAADICARHYQEPILTYTDLPLVNNQQEYDIPDNAFEDRLEHVEVIIRGIHYELKYINYRQLAAYEIPTPQQVPSYYTIKGRKFRLIPAAIGSYIMRIWWLQNPETLQLSQGRVTVANPASNYVVLDSVGADLTTAATDNNCYVNFVNGTTGVIKGSAQIASIVGNKVTFKSTPDRLSVYGKNISGTLPVDLSLDDQISTVTGTCVPILKKPFSNFFVQFTVSEIRRRLGDDTATEMQVLKDFEDQVKHTWAGREQSIRITKRSRNWLFPRRRLYS